MNNLAMFKSRVTDIVEKKKSPTEIVQESIELLTCPPFPPQVEELQSTLIELVEGLKAADEKPQIIASKIVEFILSNGGMELAMSFTPVTPDTIIKLWESLPFGKKYTIDKSLLKEIGGAISGTAAGKLKCYLLNINVLEQIL